jgi:hypothetical protein
VKNSTRNVAILVVVVAAGYGCLSVIFRSVPVRFRLTMEVMDGDQIRTGSSVIEVEYPIYPDGLFPGQNTGDRQVTGYAVTVDLGQKGLLFLTFHDGTRSEAQERKRFRCLLTDIACLPFAAYGTPSRGVDSLFRNQKAALDELLRQNGPREIAFENLPELVRFLNISDKATERIVSPFDLSASFGPGVQLNRVALELTTAPITPEPKTWPGWLKSNKQYAEFGE